MSLVRNLIRLCKLEGKPQDLPCAVYSLLMILLVTIIANIGILYAIEAKLSQTVVSAELAQHKQSFLLSLSGVWSKIQYAIIDVGTKTLGLYLLLTLRGMSVRFVQSAIAIFGVTILIFFFMTTLMSLSFLVSKSLLFAEILFLVTMIWSFIVNMRIFSFSLSVEYWLASLITLAFGIGTQYFSDMVIRWVLKV